jgi:hypothetical protein
VRRPTAITLIVLFVLITVVAVIQLTQDPPPTPYPGPVEGTPLPTQISPAPEG